MLSLQLKNGLKMNLIKINKPHKHIFINPKIEYNCPKLKILNLIG